MLHTSLHNPSVKDKPSVETFISMNRGIDNGKDLPSDLLMVLYYIVIIIIMTIINHRNFMKMLKEKSLKYLIVKEEVD